MKTIADSIQKSAYGIKKTAGNLYPLIIPGNKCRLFGGAVLTSLNMGLNLVTPYIFSRTIIALATQESTMILENEISPMTMAGLYGASYALSSLVTTARNYTLAPIGPRATEKLVVRYMHHLMAESLNYHISTPLGDHINRLRKCFEAIPNVTTQMFTQILPTLLEISFAVGILSNLYNREVAVGLVTTLIAYVGYSAASGDKITKIREEMGTLGFKTFEDIVSTISNYETIQAFNNLPDAIQKFSRSMHAFTEADIKANKIIQQVGGIQTTISGLGFAILSGLVANAVLKNKLSVSDYVTICSYLMQFSAPLAVFGTAINSLRAALTELGIVFDEFDKKPEITDPFSNKHLEIKKQDADIRFNEVKFHYDEKRPILRNVTFTIPAGKKVGIVGRSGAGKSTLTNIIYRHYDTKAGDIYIGGEKVTDYSIDSVRKLISIVPQAPVLFNDTLYNNIAYGGLSRPGGVTKEDVEKAVEAACLTDFVKSLDKGLDTVVGERGAKLSGGQKQRVAIARAFLKNPHIYIFDEATSALDNEVKKEIQENMDKVSQGVTTIVITHDLTGLINADLIIVFDKGIVAEQGTHEELLVKNGVYADLWKKMQSSATGLYEDSDASETEEKQAEVKATTPEISIAAKEDKQPAEAKLSTSKFTTFAAPELGDAPNRVKDQKVKEICLDIRGLDKEQKQEKSSYCVIL